MNKPEVTIIHHTAVGGSKPQFFAVNEYHKSQDFPCSSLGYYVGYHFFIEKNGATFQARRDTDIGAHTVGWNDRSIGICLAGDFNRELPTQAQLRALQRLTERLRHPVDLHRNRQANRTCPGGKFTLDLITPDEDEEDARKREVIEKYMTKYTWLKSLLAKYLKT